LNRSATRTILAVELLAWRHRFLGRSRVRLALLIVFLVIAAVMIGGGSFVIGAAAARFLPGARDVILAGGFTMLSVLMLVVGFPTVIASLFVGRELLQLVVAPVRPIEIFVSRVVLAMTANFFVGGILLMAILGVGVGSGASFVFYPLAVLLIFLQVLVVTSLQTILMSVVLRWVPARLARDVAAGIAGVSGAAFYLVWNFNLRQSFVPRGRPDLTNLTSIAQRVEWLPSAWPGHALSGVIAGSPGSAVVWVLLSLALTALLVGIAATLYGRTLVAGLGVFGGERSVWKRSAAGETVAVAKTGAASPARAIARKDWLGYRRDVRRLSRMLPAFLFPIGYVVAFLRPARGGNSFWTEVFLVAFITMFMSSALGTPSVPTERRGFQLLRMAPMTMWQVLRAKVSLTLIPVLVVTLVISVVISVVSGSDFGQLSELALLVVWLGVGFVSIGVAAGAIDPHFDAVDDRRAVGIVGTLAGVGGAIGFGVLSVGAFALFIYGVAAAEGTAQLRVLPSTPAVGALMFSAGLVLTVGAGAVVGTLMWIANSRLGHHEGAIAAS
jgi:ABC-2 type transport system permease protein